MKIFIQVDGDCIGNNDNSDRDLICTIPRRIFGTIPYHTTNYLERSSCVRISSRSVLAVSI